MNEDPYDLETCGGCGETYHYTDRESAEPHFKHRPSMWKSISHGGHPQKKWGPWHRLDSGARVLAACGAQVSRASTYDERIETTKPAERLCQACEKIPLPPWGERNTTKEM